MNISELNTSSGILLQWMNGQLDGNSSASTGCTTDDKSPNLLTDNTSMTTQVASMVELTKYVMDAMGIASNSRVTFSRLNEYREQLQSEFTREVNDGLKALEVNDLNFLKFTLQVNDDGTINVITNNPDKDKIQNFFENSPELIATYKKIEALNGIDAARKNLDIPQDEMRKRIQIENMASWWYASDTTGSTFGAYSDSSLALLQGVDLTV